MGFFRELTDGMGAKEKGILPIVHTRWNSVCPEKRKQNHASLGIAHKMYPSPVQTSTKWCDLLRLIGQNSVPSTTLALTEAVAFQH